MAFSKVTAGKLQKQGEYKQNFRWAIDFGQLLTDLANNGVKTLSTISNESLQVLCQSVEPPKKTIQTAEVMSRGMKIKISGWADFGNTMTITFMDTISNPVQKLIDTWQDLCFKTSDQVNGAGLEYGTGIGTNESLTPTDKQPFGLGYKTSIPLARVNMAGTPIYQVMICGVFCEDFDPGGTLDEQSSDVSKPSLTLSFDTIHVVANGSKPET